MARFCLAAFFSVFAVLAAAAADPACEHRVFEQSAFLVCRYDAKQNAIALALADRKGVPLRSFRRLAQNGFAHLRFAMNAGMFRADGRPVGLYIENSKQLKGLDRAEGAGNFYLEPNGVFAVFADGTVAIETAAAFGEDKRAPRWATQSGPMLVIDGRVHPKILPTGTSEKIRNGVCVRDGTTAIFAIAEEPVTFYAFALLFRDGLGCANALFLDGSVSSLYAPDLGRDDELMPLGPMIGVSAPAATP